MGPIGCPETSVKSYHYSFHNSPEEHISDLQSLYANDWIRRLNGNLMEAIPMCYDLIKYV
jgi:hypothetical protein